MKNILKTLIILFILICIAGIISVSAETSSECIQSNPTLSITPLTQTGFIGSTLNYSLTIKNNDNSACAASTFSVSTKSIPTGFTVAEELLPTSISINPGRSFPLTNALRITSSNTTSQGNNTIIISATNDANNTYTTDASTFYVLQDTTPPIITLNGANPQLIEVYTPYTELGATVNDNIDQNLLAIIDPSAVNTSFFGNYSVIYNAQDLSANNATPKMRTIIVADRTKPVITLNGADSINIPLNSKYEEFGAIVTDNYDINLTVTILGEVDNSTLGTYTISYSAQDSSGNANNVTRTVNVIDVTAPSTIINLNETSKGTNWILWQWTNPADSDFDHVQIWFDSTNIINVSTPINYYNLTGLSPNTEYSISIKTVDKAGNINQNSISDLARTNQICIRANPTVFITPSTKSGAPGSQLTYSINITNNDNKECGYSSFYVGDKIMPSGFVSNLHNSIYGNKYWNFISGGQATFPNTIKINSSSNSTQGDHLINLTVRNVDNLSYSTEVQLIYNIPDTIPPIITIPAVSPVGTTLQSGTIVTYTNPTAIDGVDGTITPTCNYNSGENFPVGDTTVTCTATDKANNTATALFNINVFGICVRASPTVSIIPSIQSGIAGSELAYSYNITNNDNFACPGNFFVITNKTLPAGFSFPNSMTSSFNILPGQTLLYNNSIKITSPITAAQRSYPIVVDFKNGANNSYSTEVQLIYNIPDTIPPNITLIGNKFNVIEIGTTYNELGAIVTDNVDTNLNYTITGTVNTNVKDTYTIIYNARDSAGNNATPVTRVIYVVDTLKKPTIMMSSLNVTLYLGQKFVEDVEVSDYYDGKINATITGTVNENIIGDYILTYNAINSMGNIADEVTRVVHIISPIIINYTNFDGGATTNFSAITNFSHIENLTVEKSISGKIVFNVPISIDSPMDLDMAIKITDKLISINSTAIPGLNRSATISFYNIVLTTPRILLNGNDCPSNICTLINYTSNIATYNVTGFSEYSLTEGASSGGGSSGGGSSGGGGGGSSGGGIIVTNITSSGNVTNKTIAPINQTIAPLTNETVKGSLARITGGVIGTFKEWGTIRSVAILLLALIILVAIISFFKKPKIPNGKPK